MNLGRKKSTSLEPPERSLETSSKNCSRLLDQRTCTLGGSPSLGRQGRRGSEVSRVGEPAPHCLSSLHVVLTSNQTLSCNVGSLVEAKGN